MYYLTDTLTWKEILSLDLCATSKICYTRAQVVYAWSIGSGFLSSAGILEQSPFVSSSSVNRDLAHQNINVRYAY